MICITNSFEIVKGAVFPTEKGKERDERIEIRAMNEKKGTRYDKKIGTRGKRGER